MTPAICVIVFSAASGQVSLVGDVRSAGGALFNEKAVMIATDTLDESTDAPGPGLDVLNCYRGHLRMNFDRDSPDELARAKGIIRDMLARGYTVFVEYEEDGEKKTERVTAFDPDREVYIIGERKKTRKKKEVPMRKARATGVGRTAGG